jgi:hypothetical protein
MTRMECETWWIPTNGFHRRELFRKVSVLLEKNSMEKSVH